MNNEKKLEELFDKATAEAEDLLQDEDKMERFFAETGDLSGFVKLSIYFLP